MISDDQPTQPLTDAERCQPVYVHTYGLDRETWEKLFDRVADAAHALDEAVSCSSGNECALCGDKPTREELSAEVDRLRAEIATMGRYMHELDRENERLRLETAQMESGAQIAMNAGVTALQEVKRLEKFCADLKLINDRIAADRTRLIEERDGWEDNATDTLRQLECVQSEATGPALGHLAKLERLQSQRDALVRKLGLNWGPDEFGDLSAVPDAEKPCLDSPDWACRLGPRCVCSKYEHDTRHECACGSWWYSNE